MSYKKPYLKSYETSIFFSKESLSKTIKKTLLSVAVSRQIRKHRFHQFFLRKNITLRNVKKHFRRLLDFRYSIQQNFPLFFTEKLTIAEM